MGHWRSAHVCSTYQKHSRNSVHCDRQHFSRLGRLLIVTVNACRTLTDLNTEAAEGRPRASLCVWQIKSTN
jgi:hypothetical protein